MAKTLLRNFLKQAEFAIGAYVTLTVDPATQFGHIATVDGKVERVRGTPQVIVPVHDWQAFRVDEEATIAKVLIEAAEANPLKLGAWDQMKTTWPQLRGMRLILINPATLGKFSIPLGFEVVKNEDVPTSRVVVVKTPDLAGYYIKQGHRRNILAHNKRGLCAIQVYEPKVTKPEPEPEPEPESEAELEL